MALTLSYYAIVILLLLRYFLKKFVLKPWVVEALNLESIFAIGSTICLILFAGKTLFRLL